MPTWSYVTGSAQAFSASIPIPVSGQPVLAQDVYEPVRVLADRTQFLSASKANISGSNRYPTTSTNYFSGSTYLGDTVFSGSTTQSTKTVTRYIGAHKAVLNSGLRITGSNPMFQYTTSPNVKFYFPIDDVLVHGCTITGYDLTFYATSTAPVVTTSFAYGADLGYGAGLLVALNNTGSFSHSPGNGTIKITGTDSFVVNRNTKSYYLWMDVGTLSGSDYCGPISAKITYTMTSVLEPAG